MMLGMCRYRSPRCTGTTVSRVQTVTAAISAWLVTIPAAGPEHAAFALAVTAAFGLLAALAARPLLAVVRGVRINSADMVALHLRCGLYPPAPEQVVSRLSVMRR